MAATGRFFRFWVCRVCTGR